MADTDFTSVYRQFFEDFAKTVKPEDPLPIRVPGYNLDRDEMTGEVIESCIQYLTVQKCPQSLFVPLIKIAVEEIQREIKKNPKHVYDSLKVMQMSTSKINEICLRYRDNEKLSSLPPPVEEPYISQHAIKHMRRKMEDRHVCLPRFNTLYNIQSNGEASYYGLFDGHSGTAAASFAVSHLHQFLAESQYYPHDPVSAFREAYQKTEIRYSYKELRGGTTAIAILHQHEEKKLIVSWVGDSQAMLVKQEGYLMVVDPHKPDRKDEFERIHKLGGFVSAVNGSFRVNGQLAVSRAIGDGQWKPYVSAEPDIWVINLTGSEEFIVIACDGLWDVVEPEEVIRAVYSEVKENPDNIEAVSRRLVDLAKKNSSTDNISVIVVFFADPVEVSKRSVEARGPGPNNPCEGEMNTDFRTAAENSPLVPLSDSGMNRIYEENGTCAEYVPESKDDSDEDCGPETDIDSVDVLVPSNKCMNPFASNTWKEGADCDNLIDYPKPDDLNVDKAISFTDNLNNLMTENMENQSAEEEMVRELPDDVHVNQMNLANIPVPDGQNVKFSNYNFVTNEFIDNTKFDKELEKSVDSDLCFGSEKPENFVAANEFSGFENFGKNTTHDFETFSQKNIEHDPDKDVMDANDQVLCNGNAEIYSGDKIDVEKPVSPAPLEPETGLECKIATEDATGNDADIIEQPNDCILETSGESGRLCKEEEFPADSSTEKFDLAVSSSIDAALNIPPSPSDSENTSQKELDTPELLSPVNQPLDEKLKDDIIAESGGELDSEDEGWKYVKVGSGPPATVHVNLAASPELVPETDKQTMNSPLNPNAAEFVPVSPVPNPNELEKTPIRNIPPSVNDIVASSPNWNNMDDILVPDEVCFLSEIKSRPSNIFLETDSSANDLEGLGCSDLNLDNKEVQPDLFSNEVARESYASENFVPEPEQQTSQSPVHGIALANDMTSSFIDPSTMSCENDLSKQELELIMHEKEMPEFEIQTTLNVDATEFKFELAATAEPSNKLPDLLSPLPVEEEGRQAVDTNSSADVPNAEILDIARPLSPDMESGPTLEKSPDLQTEILSPEEVPDSQPQKIDVGEVVKDEVEPVAAVAITPEPVSKLETPDTHSAAVAVVATAAAAAGATAVVSAATAVKEDTKKITGTPKTATATATSKITKSSPSPRTPVGTKTVPAAKKPSATTLTRPATAKTISNSVSSPIGAKPATSKVSTATARTATTKTVTSTTTPRPLARRTAPAASTATTSKTTTVSAKPLTSKLTTAPVKTAVTPKVASTATVPKPKPRVPSASIEKKASPGVDNEPKTKRTEVLAKKPSVGSSTVTTTTRTTTSRPASAPVKSTVKASTMVTTTRTSTAKPRTAPTGVTTTTTTTTRTVLNSKKPLNVTTRDVGNKPMSKTVVAKVNGLANGSSNKTKKTTVTSSTATKTKIEDKTETKAENVLDEMVDMVENPVMENIKDVNLMNGISHD